MLENILVDINNSILLAISFNILYYPFLLVLLFLILIYKRCFPFSVQLMFLAQNLEFGKYLLYITYLFIDNLYVYLKDITFIRHCTAGCISLILFLSLINP